MNDWTNIKKIASQDKDVLDYVLKNAKALMKATMTPEEFILNMPDINLTEQEKTGKTREKIVLPKSGGGTIMIKGGWF